MKTWLRIGLFCCALVTAFTAQAQNPAKHAITFDDLIKMHRVSGAAISKDRSVAYAVSTPDIEANRSVSNIWVVSASGNSTPVQITQGGRDNLPAWSPDGKTVAFISSRDGTSQVYLLSMAGGEAKKLTQLSTGADLFHWSPDGKTIALTSSVYPDCKDDACNEKRDADKEKNKVKARIYDHLLYRHWDHWSEGKRSHLFVVPVDGSAAPKDLTAGADYDVPPEERSGPGDFNFSPDSKELSFTAVTDKVEAISTNADLFVVPITGGEAKRITTQQGFDGNPVYSPDGRYIAYHAQLTPGYEADKWRVMLYDRQSGKNENLSESFDRSATDLDWSPDSKTIYFLAENETLQPIYSMEPCRGHAQKACGWLQRGICAQRRWKDFGHCANEFDAAQRGLHRFC